MGTYTIEKDPTRDAGLRVLEVVELHAELFFELLDAGREGWLGEAEALGRVAYALDAPAAGLQHAQDVRSLQLLQRDHAAHQGRGHDRRTLPAPQYALLCFRLAGRVRDGRL